MGILQKNVDFWLSLRLRAQVLTQTQTKIVPFYWQFKKI